MIGRLRGQVVWKQAPQLLIDVNGVGYEVEATMNTFYTLPLDASEVILYTHLVVREDAQLLYGFASEAERAMFRGLIKINGVGAKMALTILSGMSIDDFSRCIREGDTVTLTRLPGVGKKTAERLIIEMRDRLDKLMTHVGSTSGTGQSTLDAAAVTSPRKNAEGDAVSALVALGYKAAEASRMVRAVESKGLASEAIIRAALQATVIK
ncbi:MAG: Holliday junction branch migration protein RuvA [Thiotrichales bacterium]|nr:MAG: Holliday junction branch migration protein RuvA [Thiotrichales bacterium]PCI12798.1 MAG: Holliday junction branch migration protein RuvA [Thiotrichales bacterium]